jgi:alanine-glyoxylate transaminase/serine-glyoxylate transaminase/serine-pyruvate transaminase
VANVSYRNLNPPIRILLGPGPSNIHPRVQFAMSSPLIGHLDPYFQHLMDETVALLRHVFRTQNKITFPISGTGSAGMEAAFDNFLEPGDVAVIGVNGVFGERMVDNAQRTGATVIAVAAEWGKIIEPDQIEAALRNEKKVKLIALVHVETSTGVIQPLADISALAKKYNCLFLVDTVTSLGGHEVAVDDWGIDICYSGTQKCLSCPPGLAPFTANEKALAMLQKRTHKEHSWYLDISMLSSYWVSGRVYHHTAPVSMIYAIHEALALVADEGLEVRVKRHLQNGAALHSGIRAMGLELHAQEGYRASSLTTVRIPSGVDGGRIVQKLLTEYSMEIGSGLGPLKGKIWRIGMMGHSSTKENVFMVLNALEKCLSEEGYSTEPGAGVAAAIKTYNETPHVTV